MATSVRVHFGLGAATQIDGLELEWPSGQKDLFKNLGVNSIIRIVESEGRAKIDQSK